MFVRKLVEILIRAQGIIISSMIFTRFRWGNFVWIALLVLCFGTTSVFAEGFKSQIKSLKKYSKLTDSERYSLCQVVNGGWSQKLSKKIIKATIKQLKYQKSKVKAKKKSAISEKIAFIKSAKQGCTYNIPDSQPDEIDTPAPLDPVPPAEEPGDGTTPYEQPTPNNEIPNEDDSTALPIPIISSISPTTLIATPFGNMITVAGQHIANGQSEGYTTTALVINGTIPLNTSVQAHNGYVEISLPAIGVSCVLDVFLSNDGGQTFSQSSQLNVTGFESILDGPGGSALTLESVSSAGVQGNAKSISFFPIAREFIAFSSQASNLVPGDNNNSTDVFVRDLLNRTTRRLSVSAAGIESNGSSTTVGISRNARYVGFSSIGSNLVSPDVNNKADYFIVDRDPNQDGIFDQGDNTIVRINLREDGIQSLSTAPTIGYAEISLSQTGRYVAIVSTDSDLVSDDTNGQVDVFVIDRDADNNGQFENYEKGLGKYKNVRVSKSSQGVQGNGPSTTCSISGDGRYVVFESQATNLVSGDTNFVPDVFLKDLNTDAVLRLSESELGAEADGPSIRPHISIDGRFVVFASRASNLVPGVGSSGIQNIYLYDRDPDQDGTFDQGNSTLKLLSVGLNSTPANNSSSNPMVSDDGERVVFESSATNLVSGDTNGRNDIFLWEAGSDSLRRISIASDGTQSSSQSLNPSIAEGPLVTFNGTDLTSADSTNFTDLLLWQPSITLTPFSSIVPPDSEQSIKMFHTLSGSNLAYIVYIETIDSLPVSPMILSQGMLTGATYQILKYSLAPELSGNQLTLKVAIYSGDSFLDSSNSVVVAVQ